MDFYGFIVGHLCIVATLASQGTCPEGYSPDEVMGLCYYVSTNAVTWLQARDQCLSNGTELAEPRDPFEELINDTLSITGSDMWLGVTSPAGSAGFSYASDGVAVTLPIVWKDGRCAALDKTGGLCTAEVCSRELPFVCVRPTAGNNPNGNCAQPSTWKSYNGGCYAVFTSPKTYVSADGECVNQGGHLAQLTTQGQVDHVISILTGDSQYWVDGSDLNNQGVWSWYDDTAITWFPWQADGPDSSERCVATTGASWESLPCNSTAVLRHFLCQTNMVSGATTTPTPTTEIEISTVDETTAETSTGSAVTQTQYSCSTSNAAGNRFQRWNVTSAEATYHVTQDVRSLLECVATCLLVQWCDAVAVSGCCGAACGRRTCHLMQTGPGGQVVTLSDFRVMRRLC